jgi:hypothetical protein
MAGPFIPDQKAKTEMVEPETKGLARWVSRAINGIEDADLHPSARNGRNPRSKDSDVGGWSGSARGEGMAHKYRLASRASQTQ